MSRHTNPDANFSQDGRSIRWYSASAETTTSASDSGFCEVNPIIIAPDKDDCRDERSSNKDSSLKYEKSGESLNAVPRGMMQFQVQAQQVTARKVQHASFQNADFHQRGVLFTSNPVSNYPSSASGIPILNAVIADTNSFPQTFSQLPPYPAVTTPSAYANVPIPGTSGRVYPSQSSDCSIISLKTRAPGTHSNIPVSVNQFNDDASNVGLQTSRDVLVPKGFSGGLKHQQHSRKIPEAQEGRVFVPSLTSSQSSTGSLLGPSQSAGSLPQPSVVICITNAMSEQAIQTSVPQQLSAIGDRSNSLSSGLIRSSGNPNMQCQIQFGASQSITDQDFHRNMQPQDPVQSRPKFPTSIQDHVRMSQVLKRDVDIKPPPIDDFPGVDMNFQSQEQVFNQLSRPLQSTIGNQNVRQQNLDGSQSMQQWTAAASGDKNCQPFGSLEGSTLQPQSTVLGQNSLSEGGQVGQTLRPVGGQNYMLQGSGVERGLPTQSAVTGEISQSQGFQGSLSNQPLNALQGQTLQSQNFQSQDSLTGPGFQQSGQVFQPQESAYSQVPQPQSLAVGPADSKLLQSSFGNQSQSLGALFGNINSFESQDSLNVPQPPSLAHGQNLQQESSLGFGATQTANINARLQTSFSSRPSSQNQLPASVESRVERPQHNQPLAEHRQTPELVNSNKQHHFGSLPSGQKAENLTMSNLEHSLTPLASNQNSESSQFSSSQALLRVVQGMLSHPNSPALSSLSEGSFQSRSASTGLPSQAYGAVLGVQKADEVTALPSFQGLSQKELVEQQVQELIVQQQQLQQQAVQQQQNLLQQQQHKLEEQKATEQQQQAQQQLVQQQQLQQFQQQQQMQQLQEQLLQQQLQQQLQSNLGGSWPTMAPVASNQQLFANNAPAAAPGSDLWLQLLPVMMANLPMLNFMSQSYQSYGNPSLGGFNAFSMAQPSLQQQMANMLAANMAQSFGVLCVAPMAPSGLETNPMANLLYQMLGQTQAPPQPVVQQPGDGSAANSMMQMMLQNLRGSDYGRSTSAGQQLLKNFPSLFENSSRPGSGAGQLTDVSQQLPLQLSINGCHSLVDQPPDVGTGALGSSIGEEVSEVAVEIKTSGSTKVSPVKQKKRRAKVWSPRKKSRRQAAGVKDKGANLREDRDQSEHELEKKNPADVDQHESDADEVENAGGDDIEGEDDDAGNANPSVYIDVAWGPSDSPTKTDAVKPLSPSKRVIENGRRIVTKGNRKKTGSGKASDSSSVVSGRKRKGDKPDDSEGSRKRGRLSSDEERDDTTFEHSENAAETESSLRGKRKTPVQGERTASLRSGGREGGTTLQSSRGKPKAMASRDKAASGSCVSHGNQATEKGAKQKPSRMVDKRTSHSRGAAKTGNGKGKQILPGSSKDAKKEEKADRGGLDETRKTEEATRSSDTVNSSNGGVSDDSPGSSSAAKSPSKESQEQEKNKTLLRCARNQPVISMPKLSLVSVDFAVKQLLNPTDQDKAAEVLGVRKCRLKQLALANQPPDWDSDNDRRGWYSDSSSSGDFGSARDRWKPKSKSSQKTRSPAFKSKPRKRAAATTKKMQPDDVGSADNQNDVAPGPSNIRILQEGESQGDAGPAATTSAESASQVLASVGYVRRSRGRPSLFQTFQSELHTANVSASTSAVGEGRTSPAMPVLIKESTVRAVARVSPLLPPAVNEALKAKLALIEIVDSVNEHINSQLQTVFVKLDESSDVMNVLISFKALSDNMVFQCTFCSFTDFSAKVVSDHVHRSHLNYMFAATRTPMPTGDVMYLFCRHCSFVTHDKISMWIHFEICHGVAHIVYGSDVTEVTPQVTRQLVLNRDQQAIVPSFYQCIDCELLVADNRHIADHAVKNHGEDGSCYRGCFAKARVINKPKSAPITVTYNQLLSDEYVDQRKEVFICVRCSYIAYAEYLAISHHIMSHLDLRMMFPCHVEGCGNRDASAEAAIQHMKANHADVGSRILRGTVTLLSSQSSGDLSELKECEIHDRKDNGKKKVVPQKANLAQPVRSAKTVSGAAEKSTSTRTKGKSSDTTAAESTSEDSSHERPSSAASASNNTNKKGKQMTSKQGQKNN